MSARHTITLPRLSVRLLSQLLAVPGLCVKPSDFYLIGQAQCEAIPELVVPKFDSDAAELAWADAPVEFTLSERQRDAVKVAVGEAVKQGKVGASKYFYRIVEQLGLTPE